MKLALLLTTAVMASAQTAPPKPVAGTVTEFKGDTLEIGVRPDLGAPLYLKIAPETEIFRVAAGERDLRKAKATNVTDIVLGDRLLASFVTGMPEPRRIVLITASDIARRNEAESQDWRKRGISGVVTAKSGTEIVLEIRTSEGAQTITAEIGPKTIVRRYGPDSIKFAEATASRADEIAVADQFRARGRKSEDGKRFSADEVVFGTFLTRFGTVTAFDPTTGRITLRELNTQQPLTITVTADSQIKRMPEFKAMVREKPQAGAGAVPSMAQIIERLPRVTLDDVKVGGGVVVSSTRGSIPNQATAILLLTNADSLLAIARAQSADPKDGKPVSPMDAIIRMHGGMLGAAGLNIPAILP